MATVFWIKVVIFGTEGFLLSFVNVRTFRLPHVLTLPLAGSGFLFLFLPGNGITPIRGAVSAGMIAAPGGLSGGTGESHGKKGREGRKHEGFKEA